jgi:glutathione S-transferase
MSLLTLYSYRRCPFAIRVRMVLAEKEILYQLIEEKLSELSPELMALHPEGRVPLLVHEVDGHRQIIYQSSIITEYLDEAFPGVALMPLTASGRAQVRLWTYWCDQLFKPDLDLYKYELKRLSEGERADLVKRLHAYLAEWENGLGAGPFILGAKLTLADIHLFPFARQFMAIPHVLPGLEAYPRFKSWLAQMVARPTFLRVMQK